jgi:Tfp pilus assembly protein PilZ
VVSYVANLSGGGIMIETSMPAPVGTTIDLRLLTDRGAVHASGKVAWSGREGMGLAFQA